MVSAGEKPISAVFAVATKPSFVTSEGLFATHEGSFATSEGSSGPSKGFARADKTSAGAAKGSGKPPKPSEMTAEGLFRPGKATDAMTKGSSTAPKTTDELPETLEMVRSPSCLTPAGAEAREKTVLRPNRSIRSNAERPVDRGVSSCRRRAGPDKFRGTFPTFLPQCNREMAESRLQRRDFTTYFSLGL
jgi:hypothetical protein